MKNYTVEIKTGNKLAELLGVFDENLNVISKELGVVAFVDDGFIKVTGEKENVDFAKAVIEKLLEVVNAKEPLDKSRILYCIDMAREGNLDGIEKIFSGVIAVTSRGKQIKPKTVGQKKYVDAINKNTVIFGVGPAGTGKTYLAVCMAAVAYKQKLTEKIILTRPAVEAGEKLGFLPGDLQNKVDPYLRPLYDALGEMFGYETYQKLIEKNIIEIAPLAYMRGRTLSNSYVILDEAQNTTKEQMKMFLTRLGENSKMLITGDVTQIDLPQGKESGLIHATKILKNVEGIETVVLTHKDVVRNPLVAQIVKAYVKSEESQKEIKNESNR
ncbi:MAG: PhoH family protein [Clostridia bacterium]|nr:PhoH family protein [Clostridia bacterium]